MDKPIQSVNYDQQQIINDILQLHNNGDGMLANKKVYVGKFGKEIIEKAKKLGFKRSTEDLEKMPFLIFIGGFNSIRSMFYIDSFNNHPFKEVTPEWILNLPEGGKSWDRLGSRITGFEVSVDGINPAFVTTKEPSDEFDIYNVLPSKEEAEAYRVLPKLLYWRDFYNEGWKPDWENKDQWKYCIYLYEGEISDTECLNVKYTFAFKSKKIMDKFIEDFKEELEIVKPLL